MTVEKDISKIEGKINEKFCFLRVYNLIGDMIYMYEKVLK